MRTDYRKYLGYAVLALGLLVVIAVAVPRERSFLVNARTQGFTLQPQSHLSQVWPFARLALCERRSASSGGVPGPFCDARLFNQVLFDDASVSFASGSTVQVALTDGGDAMVIYVRNDGDIALHIDDKAVGSPATLVIPAPQSSVIGALPLSGRLTVGNIPASGEDQLLEAGEYQIRGRPLLSPNAVTWAEGRLFPGDKVSVVAKDKAIIREAIGHASLRDGAIGVQYLTEPGNSYLKLERLGAEPNYVGVTWIQRSLADPLIIFLSVFLALLVAAIDLFQRIVRPRGD